ncbi:MAG: dTMP kinase [Clostridiales bacterium]|nr:dTMP kinase [Clostridiales bacterium]
MTDRKIAGRGKFIVFEGIDGCGKTTHVSLLRDHISKLTGRQCAVEREPDSRDIVGAIIRTALYGGVKILPESMAYLHVADRLEHIAFMLPLLEAGTDIVCDRYYLSNMAYNATPSLSVERIYELNRPCTEKLQPDLVIFLDVDPAVSAKRRTSERTDSEIYDAIERQIAIRSNYMRALEIAEADGVKIARISTEADRETVARQIRAAVAPLFAAR